MPQRHAAWRRLVRRRSKAVRLVEELNLRTQRLQPLVEKLNEISQRMDVAPRADRRTAEPTAHRPIGFRSCATNCTT